MIDKSDEFLADYNFEDFEYGEKGDDKNYNNPENWSNYVKYEDLLNISYFNNIEYLYKSDEKFVVLDKKINKKVAITRETIGKTEELIALNSKLKFLNKQGYKIGDYVELFLPEVLSNQYSLYLYELDEEGFSFYIDEVEVTLKKASDMFIFLSDIKHGYYTNIDKYTDTISLKGVNEINYADYYNQSIFMLSMVPKIDNPAQNNKVYGDVEIEKIKNSHYINKNYNEVFYFYNEAMRIFDREISSLYLYKILEYFFLITRRNEFEIIINDYNNHKDIDIFMKKIMKLYKDEELEQLIILMNSIKNQLNNILDKATKLGILSSSDITVFAKELYSYRNSIVHGKSDYKFDLKIPNAFYGSEKDLFWKDSLKYISEILLFRYCIQRKTI